VSKTFEEVMALTDTVNNRYMLQLDECRAMYDTLMELPDGATCVEVGCDRGRSSSLIYQIAKEKNFLTIHIDPWHPSFDNGIQPTKAKEWMEVMCEKCEYHPFILLRMTTEQAADHLSRIIMPEGIDFAFIDGSHDQDIVEWDLDIVANKVIPEGFLAIHDYPSGGVTEAVEPFVAHGWEKHCQAGGLGVWRRI